MEQRTLKVVKRTETKKGASKKLRAEGFIPAVMYGHSETKLFAVNEREFLSKFKTISENTIINLEDGNDVYHVLIKDFQEIVMSATILHVDFYEVEKGKVLHTHVPVHVTGNSAGVRAGGMLEHVLHEMNVECLPKDIPASIDVDVTELEMGKSIHVKELSAIEGVKFLASDDQVVVHVTHAGGAAAVESTEEETA